MPGRKRPKKCQKRRPGGDELSQQNLRERHGAGGVARYGVWHFNVVSGLALLLASIIADALWSAFGGSATFLGGTAFPATAALGLLAYWSLKLQCTKRADETRLPIRHLHGSIF